MFLFKRFHISSARQAGLALLAGVILLSSIATTLVSSNAFANLGGTNGPPPASNMSPDDEAKSYTYFLALKYCVRDHMYGDIKVADINANRNANPSAWFDGLDGSSGYVYPDGKKECKDIASAALPLWGWKDNQSFLSDIGYSYDGSNLNDLKWHGSSDGNTRAYGFIAAVKSKVYGSNNQNDPLVSDPAYYSMYANAFGASPCSAQDKGIYPTSNSDLNTAAEQSKTESGANPSISGTASTTGTLQYRRIDIVSPTTKLLETHVYAFVVSTDTTISSEYGNSSSFTNPTVAIIGGGPSQDKQFTKTCSQVADELSRLAPIVVKYLALNKTASIPGINSNINCTTNNSCPTPDGKTSCGIDNIGWLVCPVLGFMGKISDQLFSFLASNFLSVDTRTVSMTSGTYTAWSAMRNIANVVFVIVFLIIIFSQLSSVGVTNYGIKKMLPRIIVAAILVNLSFFICQIAVDLSNILGYGLKELFNSIQTLATPDATLKGGDATGNGLGIAVIVTAAIAGGVTLLLAITFPVLLAVALSLLLIVFILLARKALIVLLVIIAPLAFVAYLLPNTEQWYKKWEKMFISLLVVFPVISVVFGASSLAAYIIKDTAAPGDNMTPLIAIGVATIPLIMVPGILKGSLLAAGAIGTVLKGHADKHGKNVGGKIGESKLGQLNQYRKNEAQKRRALINAGVFRGSNKNPLNWGRNATSNANRAFNGSRISGKFGNRSAAVGFATADQIDTKDIADQQLIVEREIQMGAISKKGDALQQAIAKNDTVRARAITNVMFQTAGGRDEFHEAINKIEANPANQGYIATLKAHTSRNHGDMDTKDAAISNWSHSAPSVTLSANESAASTYNINDNKLAGQTKKGLVQATYNGQLDAAAAARILGDKDMERTLKPAEREYLMHISAGNAPRPKPPGTPPPGTIYDEGF